MWAGKTIHCLASLQHGMEGYGIKDSYIGQKLAVSWNSPLTFHRTETCCLGSSSPVS